MLVVTRFYSRARKSASAMSVCAAKPVQAAIVSVMVATAVSVVGEIRTKEPGGQG